MPTAGDRAMLSIRVADTGRGISADLLRASSRSKTQGGTGDRSAWASGSPSAGPLSRCTGGVISAESPGVGRGATFSFTLPTTDEPIDQPRPPTAAVSSDRHKRAVFLVEDHGDTGRILKRCSWPRASTSPSPATWPRPVERFDPDRHELLVTDIGLPDGDGLDVLRNLRRTAPHLPAIALSGYGSESDRAISEDAGFTTHLVKPVDLDRLVRAINDLPVGD